MCCPSSFVSMSDVSSSFVSVSDVSSSFVSVSDVLSSFVSVSDVLSSFISVCFPPLHCGVVLLPFLPGLVSSVHMNWYNYVSS